MGEMRFQDYLEQLTPEEQADVLANLDQEERKLRACLKRFDEDQLCLIADQLNDGLDLPADGMNVYDFLVNLYKCRKADFFYYESVADILEDIRNIACDMD